MTEVDAGADLPAKKGLKGVLTVGLVLALGGAAGGYYSVTSGVWQGLGAEKPVADDSASLVADVSFIPIEPIVVSMHSESTNRHLQFRAQLEVPSHSRTEVEAVLPRVVDVLNSYLRALEVRDLEDSSSLTRLRAQMLRRIQIVTGQGNVSNLLIMEFVVN